MHRVVDVQVQSAVGLELVGVPGAVELVRGVPAEGEPGPVPLQVRDRVDHQPRGRVVTELQGAELGAVPRLLRA